MFVLNMNTLIVKPETVNIKTLIESSNSLVSGGKFVEKLKETFTEQEQKWYVANFYMYLNYNSVTDFPINLENVWKLLGFANKGNAKRLLENNFVKDEDYKSSLLPKEKSSWGGSGAEQIMINIDTFKTLCMLVKTEEGKKVRKYYVKLENMYNELIKDQSVELNKKLQEKEQLISQLENKPDTIGYLQEEGFVYLIEDKDKPGHYKIGQSKNSYHRINQLNGGSSTNSLKCLYNFKTKNMTFAEKTIHFALNPHRIPSQKEWFYFYDESSLQCALKIIKKCLDFVQSLCFKNKDQETTSMYSETYIPKVPKIMTTSISIQTECTTIQASSSLEPDDCYLSRFIEECCDIGELYYTSLNDMKYQLKAWCKIQNLNNKNMEEKLIESFDIKQMFVQELNGFCKCITGIQLKESFYRFNITGGALTEMEKFLQQTCLKRPAARICKTELQEAYTTWKLKDDETFVFTKNDEYRINKYMNKYFFHDLYYEGKTSYLGWFGLSLKHKIEIGSGVLISKSRRIGIVKLNAITLVPIQSWASKKEAANAMCVSHGTISNWIKAEKVIGGYIFKVSIL